MTGDEIKAKVEEHRMRIHQNKLNIMRHQHAIAALQNACKHLNKYAYSECGKWDGWHCPECGAEVG